VLEALDGFDWDAANVSHIFRHGVMPAEVEEVARLLHVRTQGKAVKGEARWQLFGKTESGRFLVVVFTIRHRLFRTVTAYPMNSIERKKYGPQIDQARP
jgi:hypothetical protein